MTVKTLSATQSLLSVSVQESLISFSNVMENVAQNVSITTLDSVASSLESVVSSIDWYSTLDPVIPVLEEEFEDEEESVREIPANIKAKKPLTLEQLWTLLGTIIAIISLALQIKSMQPDPQKAELIQQNERIIELLEEQIPKDSENGTDDTTAALFQAAKSVADEIQLLIGNRTVNEVKDEINIADNPVGNFEKLINPDVDQPKADTDDETDDDNIP